MDWRLNIPELTLAQREFLCVLRAAADGHAPDKPPADWVAVLKLATAHQVADFLYSIVGTWAPSCQPAAPVMARWRTSFLSAAGMYTRAAVQANELLAALHAAKVRVIPLKGVWLAERIYDDGACRPMSDIDLLVPAEELARARATVEHLGYTTTDYYLREACNKHIHYKKINAPLPLELHWRLWHPGTESVAEPDLAQMWTGLREELLHGVPVLIFPPERQLVFLAQHILQHALSVPLKAYLDLILLCRRYTSDFDRARLEEEARAWRVLFGTKFVLQLASDIWAVPSPASVASFLRSGCECAEARRTALCATFQQTYESKQITSALISFCHVSRFRRLRIGLARILYSPSELRESCPRIVRRFGLVGGYIWRCADLIRRHGRLLRELASGGNAVKPDLENFATRQALSAWIRMNDQKQSDAAQGTLQ